LNGPQLRLDELFAGAFPDLDQTLIIAFAGT
jgi:hypothetical protein